MGCCAIRPRAMRCTARMGGRIGTGERFAIPELGATLDRLAEEGVSVLYTGDLAERIVEHVRARRRSASAG